MAYDYSKLKGKIREKYKTQGEFAKALSISESTLSLKLSNKAEWSQEEMTATLDLLDESGDAVNGYFFTPKV